MEGYRVVFEHEILFRDLDALGHVNNVAFIAFMEDARVHYWKTLRREPDARKEGKIRGRSRWLVHNAG
jgi:acyl-CoA thioester hydrolase